MRFAKTMAAAALISVAAPAVAAPMVQAPKGRLAASTQDANDLRSRRHDDDRAGVVGAHRGAGTVLIALLAAAAVIAGIIIAARGNDNPVSR